uniref:Large ribosomal subunit protein mL53 n=1 Tax=Leptobrachium leishanense TaxID=445787 RepID=A0A8C5QV76_9ANUR
MQREGFWDKRLSLVNWLRGQVAAARLIRSWGSLAGWLYRARAAVMAASLKVALVLKSVKSVAVRFCPFEASAQSAREFLESISAKKIRSTNMNCAVTVDVRHDQSEPQVDILFVDGDRFLIKPANVSSKEMLLALSAKCAAKDSQTKESAKK